MKKTPCKFCILYGKLFLFRKKIPKNIQNRERGVFFLLDKYTKKKLKNQDAVSFIDKHVNHKTIRRIFECGCWIEFYADREVTRFKVIHANFCKNRFCPMCAWRQSKKDALKICTIMDYIEVEHKKAFIFLTLTAPNVKGDEMPQEITRYNKAFKKLFERDAISKISHGYIRKLEITYNEKRNDYHIHFHCVLAVNESYFKSRDYIKQESWLNLWRDVMKDESITQVDVRRVKKSENGKEINELAKYGAKDSDYMYSQEVFDEFYKALKGRQILTYNGIFATANKMFKADELKDYMPMDGTEYYYKLLYRWGKGAYIEQERKKLTNDEKMTANKITECD